MPGPIPKPESALARPRSRKGSGEQATIHGLRRERTVTKDLKPDPEWGEIATLIFNSALASGQEDFYQDSDVALLYSLCEDINDYKNPGEGFNAKTGETYTKGRNGQKLTAILSGLTTLLLAEGDRRRVRLELQAEPEKKADLRVIGKSDYPDIDS